MASLPDDVALATAQPSLATSDDPVSSALTSIADWIRDLPLFGNLAKIVLGGRMGTAEAATAFALAAGVGGAVAQLAAGERLAQYPHETIDGRRLLIPVLVSAGASYFAGAALVPRSTGPVLTPPGSV